jgi:thioester reductase-like protein
MEPKTVLEKELADIWCEVLRISQVGIDENFFALGGNSLSIIVAVMHIRKKFGRNIPLKAFLERPTIAHLASLLGEQSIFQALPFEEVSLPSNITPHAGQHISASIETIFLTGATGFLGAHVLFDLVKGSEASVYCLVRAESKEGAKSRLKQSFHRYFPKTPFPEERVIAVQGDLSLPRFGLQDADYQMLVQRMDILYHCGAHVHHVYDYKTLLDSNVHSIIEVLKVATEGNTLKKVVYVSTISVAEVDQAEVSEEWITGSLPSGLTGGYEQTKWMAEKLLTQAFRRGIPVQIFRPNTIIGHTKTGVSSFENDHFLRLIKGCIQMKKAPDWYFKLDVLPVDFVSSVITTISLRPNMKAAIFNLSCCDEIWWHDLVCWINSAGYTVKIVPYKEWREELSSVQPDNALYALLSLYVDNEENIEERLEKKIHMRNTLEAVSTFQLEMPAVDKLLFHRIFSYLSEGFLAKKNEGFQ